MRSLVVLALLLVPSIALAESEPRPKPQRYGLMGGLALHGGNISCEGPLCGDVRKAGGGSGHIGWMLNEKMGIVLDVWGMTSEEGDLKISYVTGTVNFRYYLVPIFWVQGGVGNGHAVFTYDVPVFGEARSQTDDVPVGQLSAGLEIVRGPRWALDVQLKVAQGTTAENDSEETTGRMASVGVAFTWFGSR